MPLGTLDRALAFRDSMAAIADKEINRMRPRPRYGTVASDFVRANNEVSVDIGGEATTLQYPMGVIQPYGVGDVVRIGGSYNDQYLDDVITPGRAWLSARRLHSMVGLELSSETGNDIGITPGTGNVSFNRPSGGQQVRVINSASGWAYITDTRTTIDTWQTITHNGNLTGSVYQAIYAWRRTFEGSVDFKAYITFTTAPTSLTLTFPAVASSIMPDLDGNGNRLRPLQANMRIASNQTRLPAGCVIGSTGNIAFFQGTSNPNSYVNFEVAGVWTVAKASV